MSLGLIDKYLSKEDSFTLLRLIDQSLKSKTYSDLHELLTQVQALIGCEAATCVLDIEERCCFSLQIGRGEAPPWLGLYFLKKMRAIFSNMMEDMLHHKFLGELLKTSVSPDEFISFWEKSFHVKSPSPRCVCLTLKEESMFCFFGKSVNCYKRASAILNTIFPHICTLFIRIYTLNNSGDQPVKKSIFSPREKEVLQWLKTGKSTWEIAMLLGISERTVKFHVSNIFLKLGAVSRTQAVAMAIEGGLID